MLQVDKLIMEAMKAHDNVRTESLCAIKSAILNWKTAKENVGKEFDEATELQILKKLVKQRQESIEMYTAAGRNELADAEKAQMDVIKEFLPAEATEEDVLKAFNEVLNDLGVEPVKKNMGVFVKNIKTLLPSADGKLVATVVQKHLQ